MFESRKCFRPKCAAGVEIILRQPVQSSRPVLCQPQTNFPLGAITEIDLAVRRTKPLPQRRFCRRVRRRSFASVNSMCLQVPRVLVAKSGHEQKLSARLAASNDHAIGLFALWVGHLKIGEDGVAADIFQLEFLLRPKLFPKGCLPRLQR